MAGPSTAPQPVPEPAPKPFVYDLASDLENALSFEERIENPNLDVEELEPLSVPQPPPILFPPEDNTAEPMDVDVEPPPLRYLDEENLDEETPEGEEGSEGEGSEGEGGGNDMQVCDEAPPVAPDHPTRNKLEKHGIYVHPTYNWIICINCSNRYLLTDIHGHMRKNHPSRDKLPERVELESMLLEVNGGLPRDPPSHPIPPIHFLKVVDALRCGAEDCDAIVLHKKRLGEHYRKRHPDVKSRRTYQPIKAHPLSKFRGHLKYVEVLDEENIVNDDCLALVLNAYEKFKKDQASNVFRANENHRSRTPFVVSTNWDKPLVGVDIKLLRLTVLPPNPKTEPSLFRLLQISRDYYQHICELLQARDVSVLTLCRIECPDEANSTPFKAPDTTSTRIQYSDLLVKFISFLLRNKAAGVPRFSIELHDTPSTCLSTLERLLDEKQPDQQVTTALHELVFALLTCPGEAFIQSEQKEPLFQFLIAYHLSDDFGGFVNPTAVPPTLSKIQWCLRATAVREIWLKKADYPTKDMGYVLF